MSGAQPFSREDAGGGNVPAFALRRHSSLTSFVTMPVSGSPSSSARAAKRSRTASRRRNVECFVSATADILQPYESACNPTPSRHTIGAMPRPCVLLLWVLPGRTAPPGYTFTGVVSRWPDTGAVRAELWEAVG